MLQCYTRDCHRLCEGFIYLFIYLFIGTTAQYKDSASSSFTCLVENLEMTQGKVARWNSGVFSINGILDFSENKKAYRTLLLDSNSSMWTATLDDVLRYCNIINRIY